MRLLTVIAKLIDGWLTQGYELTSLKQVFARLDRKELPHHRVTTAPIAGRSGALAWSTPDEGCASWVVTSPPVSRAGFVSVDARGAAESKALISTSRGLEHPPARPSRLLGPIQRLIRALQQFSQVPASR